MRLDSGREFYLGRIFYHLDPTAIAPGGSPSLDQTQHDLTTNITAFH